MKVSLTEQLLWEIFNLTEDLGRVGEVFGPRSMREAFCPDLRRIRYQTQRKYKRELFSKLIYHLKKSGYIKSPDWDPKASSIIITKKGMEKVFQASIKIGGLKRRPDQKYEMVIFDIPEKKRKLRNELRLYLKKLGYRKLQQSVWISPFDVLPRTQNILTRYNLENNVKIFIVGQP